MKKLIICFLMAIGVSAFADSGAPPTWKFFPLLSGYNLLVGTNVAVTLGATNLEYTSKKGRILYSYNAITNALWYGASNGASEDALQPVQLQPDVNGNIVANAALVLYVGNTNYIPVPDVSNLVSSAALCIDTNWALGFSTGGSANQWVVGTNTYPQFAGNGNTPITVTLYAAASSMFDGSETPAGSPTIYPWETVSTFSFSFTPNGTIQCISTNLPTAFLQHARYVYAAVTNTAATGNYVLINQLGILQPQR